MALGEEKGEHEDGEHASSEVAEEEGHAGYSCSPEIGNGAGGNPFGRFDPVQRLVDIAVSAAEPVIVLGLPTIEIIFSIGRPVEDATRSIERDQIAGYPATAIPFDLAADVEERDFAQAEFMRPKQMIARQRSRTGVFDFSHHNTAFASSAASG